MQWKKVLTSQVTPGMVVAADIYSYDNRLIIGKETTLTDRIITRLKFFSIYDVPVIFDNTVSKIISQEGDAASDEIRENETFSESTRRSPEFKNFNQSFKETVNDFKSSLSQIDTPGYKLDTPYLLGQTHKLVSHSRNGLHILNMLHITRKYDDLTYIHSLNVALICSVFGSWLKMSREDIDTLTLCGLLHDVGKIKIPETIIKKPTKLTDVEFITVKMHTVKGYNMLKEKYVDQRVINASLMHHERCDGSGYPNALKASQIDEFAKIVAIADVYDAMTSSRVYRGPVCPFEVIELFESEGYQKYDPHYLLTFLNGIVQTYMHNEVKLNTGKKGRIVMINTHALTKPIVQMGQDFLDLSQHNDISIVSIL